MSTYTIRKIGLADLPLLPPLMKAAFGTDVPLAFFEWKYRDNPAGPFLGFVAEDAAGAIGAYYGVIPEWYVFGTERRRIYQSCDTMTHPDHRRRGLFQLLAQHCYDYLEARGERFVIGFGGAMSTPGFLKMGWKEILPVYQLVYPKPFALLAPRNPKGNIAPASIESIEGLLTESNAASPVRSLKDRSTFAWRIANPLYGYELFAHYGTGGVADGYLCLREESRKIYVFDCFFKTPQSRKALIGVVKSRLKVSKTALGAATLAGKNSFVFGALRKSGFMYSPARKGVLKRYLPFIVLASGMELRQYGDPACWSISLFEHDTL